MAERLGPPTPSGGDFDPLKVTAEPSDTEISGRQRRLWSLFQHTATSLTHLYKCKSKCQQQQSEEDQETWLAFQSAASSLTSLYRESADILSSLETKTHHRSSCATTTTSVTTSDLSPHRISANSKTDTTSKPTSTFTTSNVVMENEEDTSMTNTTMMTTNPPPFDFLSCSRFKRSWSPWPDDDMDHFGGSGGGGGPKRRKFL